MISGIRVITLLVKQSQLHTFNVNKTLLVTVFTLICAVFTPQAFSQDEEPPAEEAETAEGEMDMPNTGSIYIPFKPPFVVNYGGAGRLKYMKADIAVRLNDSKAANSVRHHMPYIRNNLVMLFSAQTDESINSQEGKEALRKEALEEVRNVIKQEDQQEGVIDLYFNTILVQK